MSGELVEELRRLARDHDYGPDFPTEEFVEWEAADRIEELEDLARLLDQAWQHKVYDPSTGRDRPGMQYQLGIYDWNTVEVELTPGQLTLLDSILEAVK